LEHFGVGMKEKRIECEPLIGKGKKGKEISV
jgi:hypothetical protein